MTKQIPLTQGKVALVDDDMYEYLNQWKWFAVCNGQHGLFYAARHDERKKTIYMHRVVAQTPNGMQTDHIDSNRLNNQKSNLRVCTASQNQANAAWKSSKQYKGIRKSRSRWSARVSYQGKVLHIGTFNDPKEAALAYDAKARELHGEFARLNFGDQ